jgi:hypothetical protein
MSAEEEYEVIEVPVPKIEVHVTVDDLLDALARHADALAGSAQQPQPQIMANLGQLSQLVGQLRGQIRQAVRGSSNPREDAT